MYAVGSSSFGVGRAGHSSGADPHGLEVAEFLNTDVGEFATVPGALGSSGASAAFNEHNLGGIQLRVKVLAR